MTVASITSLFSREYGSLAVGQVFTTTGRTVTEADLVNFSALTGDWHPQHCDAEWAKQSMFGERVAHGMLVLSYAVALVPFDPARLVALRRAEAVFKDPVKIGDTIHAEGRIVRIKPITDDLSLVTGSWRIANQYGNTVVRARFDVVWRSGELEDDAGLTPLVDGDDLYLEDFD